MNETEGKLFLTVLILLLLSVGLLFGSMFLFFANQLLGCLA